MTTNRTPRTHPAAMDIPMPGHYPCLTLQLNATRYHPSGQVRWVLVLRDPNTQVELHRVFQEQTEDSAETDFALAIALQDALTAMLYMQTGQERRNEAAPPN